MNSDLLPQNLLFDFSSLKIKMFACEDSMRITAANGNEFPEKATFS